MLPDEETIDWVFEASRWWIANFGGMELLERTKVLTPTSEDFPVNLYLSGHSLADEYFDIAKQHAGLLEWPLVLMFDRTPRPSDILKGMSHPMMEPPTSSRPAPLRSAEPLSVPYDIAQLDDPIDLVATMARGMSHYLLYEAHDELPAEPEEQPFFVDLGAVFLGFGIFLANSAFKFEQTTEGLMAGWGFARRGALSELDLTYVLAVVASLLDVRDRDVTKHLRPNPRSFFKSARKHIRKKRSAELQRLRGVQSVSAGPYR